MKRSLFEPDRFALCAHPAAPRISGNPRPFCSVLCSLVLASSLAGCASRAPEPKPEPELLTADRVVVKKAQRKLQLLRQGKVVREYRVSLGKKPSGHKAREGDKRTPEGAYVLDWRNPRSSFYKSLHVSYPNSADRLYAEARGFDPGGMIMIHGMPNNIRSPRGWRQLKRQDWTDGCIAVDNREMEEIWRAVKDGTPIRIDP